MTEAHMKSFGATSEILPFSIEEGTHHGPRGSMALPLGRSKRSNSFKLGPRPRECKD